MNAIGTQFSEVHDGESKIVSSNNLQFLTFTVGNEEYGVDIMIVREIKGWSDITRLPNSPASMRGVMNLRGSIIPIFDLRTRFGMGVTNADSKNVIIILAAGTRTIGILVDTVSDILNTVKNEIKSAPNSENNPNERFVSGLISNGNRMVVLLNVDKLFDDESLKASESLIENINDSH